MKSILVLTTLLSSGAFAFCPDLTGTFAKCKSQHQVLPESTQLEITQSVENGFTKYQISFFPKGSTERVSYPLLTDAQPVVESWEENGVQYEGTTSTFCQYPMVKLYSVVTANGAPWKTEVNEIYRDGQQLIQTAVGKLGDDYYSDTLNCR